MPPRQRRRRFTGWHVTVNTNHTANSAAEEQRIGDALERFVREDLGRLETWRGLIQIAPGFHAVDKVRVDGIGIERGPRRHFMHMHCVVVVEHFGKVNHKYGARQWQNLLRQRIPYLRGAYAHLKLMNTRSLNYVSKEHGSAREVRQFGIRDAVVF